MKNKIIYTAVLCAFTTVGLAQSDVDALRYSNTPALGTTARSIGLVGAVGALGADPSVVQSNPAGLAQYKTNIFDFSLGTNTQKNQSSYLNALKKNSSTFNPEFSGINLIFTERKIKRGNPTTTGWVNVNFQLGYNRSASFNRNMSFKGVSNNSYTDYVASFVKGLDYSALESNQEQQDQGYYYFENMFWYTYLIDSSSNKNYVPTYDKALGGIGQRGQIASQGGMNEFNIAYAANYEHKLYLGVAINLSNVNYSEKNTFYETDNPLTGNNWNSFEFSRNLQTSGYGVGGRLGIIFRPNAHLRVGGTLHTPTKLMLKDNYSDALSVQYDDGGSEDLKTIEKKFSYSVVTPTKYGLQAAYLFDKKGFISAEIESIDYSLMNLSSDATLFEDVNDNIATKYSNTTNLKVGAEYVLNSFRLRTGFATIGNPLASGSEYSRRIVSGGFGIQEKQWALDVGMSKDIVSDVYVPYTIPGITSQGVSNSLLGTRLMVTVTNKF